MWASRMMAIILVTVECIEVGLNILSKAAMSRGLSKFIFIVYSNAAASLLLLFCCFIFYRIRSHPQLTFFTICRIFLLALVSCSIQICVFTGIGYSSPTLASAMTDLTPAFTFVLAIISRAALQGGLQQKQKESKTEYKLEKKKLKKRMEKLDLRMKSSRAKSIGTMVSITGALIVTLYKGPPLIYIAYSPSLLLNNKPLMPSESNWVLGGFLLSIGGFLVALIHIIQTWIIMDYPSELMITLICCIFVTILSAIVSLFAEREPNAWRPQSMMELITISYAAVFVVAVRSVTYAWVCRKKGPVYLAMFKPLGIVIAVVMGVAFLGETLYIGSVIGAGIIALGFYSVMWGKSKEEKLVQVEDNGIANLESSSHNKVPLLQNKSSKV